MAYIEVEDLAQWLRIKGDQEIEELQVSVDSAERHIDAFCGLGRFDEAATSTSARVFYTLRADVCHIDPLSSDTSLTIAVDTSGDGTYNQTWASTDYQLEPLNQRKAGLTDHPYTVIRAIESKRFPTGRRAVVQVTGLWGWSTVPDAVKTATRLHAARLHARRNSQSAIAVEAAFPTRTAMGLDADVKALLMPYQRQDLWQ